MQTFVTCRNVELSREQRTWVERRVHFALSRFAGRVQRVFVTLTDVNGDRRGADQRCCVRVQSSAGNEVICEATSAVVEAAAVVAIDRAVRAVTRAIKHARELRGDARSAAGAR